MNDISNDLRNRITVLANGDPSAILSEMDKEIGDIQFTIDRLNEIAMAVQSKIDESMRTIRGHRQCAENLSSPLKALERNIEGIESKPSIKRYHALQQELSNSPSSAATRRDLRNQVQSLKAAYSNDLSNLISLMQQALVHRLNLIQCWKSMIHTEIRLLDYLKEFFWEKIMNEAEESEDQEVLQFLEQQRAALQHNSMGEPTKLSKSAIQVANVQFLRITIRDQLNEVIRLEQAISEKEQFLEHLQTVSEKMQKEVKKSPPLKQPGPGSESDEIDSKQSSQTGRMAFIDRTQNT